MTISDPNFSITSPTFRKKIINYIDMNQPRLDHNRAIFEILEGDLKTHLEERLLRDLGDASFQAARYRQSPINYYRR